MRLGAKFKLLNTLTIAYVLQGLGLHEFFTIFYTFTIQARSQFSTLPRKKSWLAWASQHALILGKILTILFNGSTSITFVIT